MMDTDSYWPEVFNKLWKVRRTGVRISRVLGREEVGAQTSGRLYLAVVHSILVFGYEMWVVTLLIRKNLGFFHH